MPSRHSLTVGSTRTRTLPDFCGHPTLTTMHPTTVALQEWAASATEYPISVLSQLTNPMASGEVCLWPWRVDEDRSFGHAHQPTPGSRPPAPQGLAIHYLVFAPDLLTLESIRAAICQNPVRPAGGHCVIALLHPLEASLLVNLFLACQVKPVPCLSLVLSAQPD